MTTRRNKATITIPKDKLPSKSKPVAKRKTMVIPKKKIESAIRPKAVAKPKPKMKLKIISKDDPRNTTMSNLRKLPNFNTYIRGFEESRNMFTGAKRSKLTPKERVAAKSAFERELLLRDAKGSWRYGASKEEAKSFREKYGIPIRGIDFTGFD